MNTKPESLKGETPNDMLSSFSRELDERWARLKPEWIAIQAEKDLEEKLRAIRQVDEALLAIEGFVDAACH